MDSELGVRMSFVSVLWRISFQGLSEETMGMVGISDRLVIRLIPMFYFFND